MVKTVPNIASVDEGRIKIAITSVVSGQTGALICESQQYLPLMVDNCTGGQSFIIKYVLVSTEYFADHPVPWDATDP
jgi:hypothetical protein